MSENKMGEFIAALRKSNGYTQQEVAEKLGVSNKTVSSWETGASCPDISMLPVIAELYGVTCDEILRGRRMPAEDAQTDAAPRREKAVALLLKRQRTQIACVCWISGGLTAFGVLLTMLIGYAALESRIGFFVGAIPLIASVVTAAIVLLRIRFAIGEEFPSANAERVSAAADRALYCIICANVTALAFIFPHIFSPVHTGLSFGWEWIGIQFAWGAGGLLLSLLVCLFYAVPVRLHRAKVEISRAASAEMSDEARAAHSELARSNELARWKYRNLLLIVFLPVAAAAIITACLSIEAHKYTTYMSAAPSTYFFNSVDSLGKLSGPFEECQFTLVSEEQEDGGRTVAKYLFADFPERWRDYYMTEDTAEGTIVTICKYSFSAIFEDGLERYEFYAYNPYWQGGIDQITATGDRIADNDGNTTVIDLKITLYNVMSLYDIRAAEENAAKHDAYMWSAVAVGIVGACSLAVSIPLYLKRKRTFCDNLNGSNKSAAKA